MIKKFEITDFVCKKSFGKRNLEYVVVENMLKNIEFVKCSAKDIPNLKIANKCCLVLIDCKNKCDRISYKLANKVMGLFNKETQVDTIPYFSTE